MLIYEKDNKLNINFENNIEEQPDLQIGKSGDKTEVLIDGQQGGGSGGTLVVNVLTYDDSSLECTVDKTVQEIVDAVNNRQNVICVFDRPKTGYGDTISYVPLLSVKLNGVTHGILTYDILFSKFDGSYVESIFASPTGTETEYIWNCDEYPLNG